VENQKLLEYSQEQKKQARQLLKKGNVINLLSKYGEVEITGSYKYDLMYGPDIDIEVITDDPRKVSFKVLQEFIKARDFQKYEYGDFAKHPRDKRPESFIIVLIQEVDGVKWEIEIWFFKQKDEDKERLEEKLINLTEEQKIKILDLKHQREQGDFPKHSISSYEIYEIVLK